MKQETRIFIADDHVLVREGLKMVLRDIDGATVVGEAENAADTVIALKRTPCDVLLLDISLPDRSGIDLIREFREHYPQMAILVLTMHREDQYAIRAMKAGASGYMNKQAATAELLTALETVSAGRKYISPALAEELARHLTEQGDNRLPHELLSRREYQTMVMIASGKTITDIGRELSLSVKTISMYRARLLEKMQLRNNAELTHYAIRNGLVE